MEEQFTRGKMAKSEPLESKDVFTGRNATHVGYKDTRYVSCWHCGFIYHLDRDARLGGKAGDGVNYDTTFTTDPSSATRNEPIVQLGCPMCGCLVYDRKGEKPEL